MNSDRIPLNVRLLAILFGSGAALLLVLFLLHRFQIQRQAGFYLDRAQAAKEAIETQDSLDAKLEQLYKASADYNNYAELKPRDNDALAEHGAMLADVADQLRRAGRVHDAAPLYRSGLKILEQVLREEPHRHELRRSQVRTYFGLGRLPDAMDHITLLATIPSDVDALEKLFDHYDLWSRLKSTGEVTKSGRRNRALEDFLQTDGKSVNRDALVSWLGDDVWMLLDDAELLSLYSQCQILLNKPELAEKPLEKAADLAPDELQTYLLLAKLLRALKRDGDANYWMSEAVIANPHSFEANRVRGQYRVALVRLSEKEEATVLAGNALRDATESLRKAIEQAIEKADTAAPSAQATKDLKAAFDSALQAMPEKNEPITPQYRDGLLEAAKRLKAISSKATNTTKETKAVRGGLLLAARAELAIARLDGRPSQSPHLQSALTYGTTAAGLFPAHGLTYVVLASIEQELGRDQKAIQWLRRGLDAKENRLIVMWHLASLLITSGQLEEARTIIAQLAEEGAPETFITHLNAMIHYASREWLLAKTGFEKTLPQLTSLPESAVRVNLMIAHCCEELGLIDQQREALTRAAKLDLTSIRVLLGLAAIEAESGQLDEAIEDYRLILRFENAPPGARVALARVLLAKNLRVPKAERNWVEVETAIEEAIKAFPNSPRLSILHAELLAAQDKPQQAVKLLVATRVHLQQEASRLDTQRQLVLQKAEPLTGKAKKEKLDKAHQLEMEARWCKQFQPSIWQALLRLAEQRENWKGADQLIQAAESELGDRPQTRLMKARNLAERYGAEAAPKIRKLLEGVEKYSSRQQLSLWRNFALLAYEIRDYQQAEELCQRVLESEPGNLGILKLRFQIAAGRRDIVTMESVLGQIRKIENRPSAFWYYGEAMRLFMLVEKGGSAELLKKALDRLARAEELRPRWGQVSVLTAMVHEQLGNENAAIEEYLQAIDLGANDLNTVRRVAQLLISKNRLREADRMFRLLAERKPLLSEETDRELRSVKTKLGEFDAALEPARKVAASSDRPEDHIWLGQLLSVVAQRMRNQGRDKDAQPLLDEAEDALRQAVILNKRDAPEPWIALIQFFGQTQQMEKADAIISQAQRKLERAVAAAALAQCYAVLNEPEKAAQQYEIAIRSAPKDAAVARRAAAFYFQINQIAKAKAQLVRILEEGEVNATEQQKAEAKHRLAQAAFEEGGRKNRQKALEWLEENLAENPNSVRDQYLRAVILASDLTGKRRQEAIASLEKLLDKQHNPGPHVQFTLAEFYRADGNWREYKLRMVELLETRGDVPRYVAAYVAALIERKDYHEAEGWAEELAKVAPNDLRTAGLRAELAFRQRQFERTRRLLGDYLQNPLAGTSRREERLPVIAAIFESYAKRLRAGNDYSWAVVFSKDAERLFRKYVDSKPGQDLLMASFLAGQGRLDDAIDLVDALWETSDPSLVARVCFAIVDETAASRKQLDRVSQILQKVTEQHPDAPVIQAAIAVVCTRQERFEEAEAIYREILRKNPNNPTTLNNLAVLLAKQGVKLKEAARLIDRAIERTGPKGIVLDSRAVVQLALGNPENALADLRRAIAEKPTPMRYFHQAEAFHATQQRKAAVKAFKNALEMGLREEYLQGMERRKFRRLKAILD